MGRFENKDEQKAKDDFKKLIVESLTESTCLRILEIIKFIGEDVSDDEEAHSMEDEFKDAVLRSIDDPLAKLALKTSEFKFCRWCA